MNNWEKKLIGKVIKFNPSESIKKHTLAKKVPMAALTEFQRKIDWYEVAEYKSGPKFRNGDILLSKITPCLENGKTAQVDILDKNEVAFGSSEFIVLRETDEVISDYIYYLAISPTFRKKAISCMEGTSGRKRVNENTLKYYELPFPKVDEQKRISKTLKLIDSKIELNKKINQEIESTIKLLYGYWFIQFDFPNKEKHPYKAKGGTLIYDSVLKREIPSGWKRGTLDDIGAILGGSTPSKNEEENFCIEGGMPWITPKDLSLNKQNKYISRGEFNVTDNGIKKASLRIFPSGTVLFSSRAPIGYLAIAANEVTTNQGFKSFIPKEPYSKEFVYYTLSYLINVISARASGSTFKEVSGSVLKAIDIVLPPFEILEKFQKRISSLIDQQFKLECENRELKETRDWLLPLLITGQVKVKNSDHELGRE